MNQLLSCRRNESSRYLIRRFDARPRLFRALMHIYIVRLRCSTLNAWFGLLDFDHVGRRILNSSFER
jgi:hypothetical protein